MDYDYQERKQIDSLLTRNKGMESLMRLVSVFNLFLCLLNKGMGILPVHQFNHFYLHGL